MQEAAGYHNDTESQIANYLNEELDNHPEQRCDNTDQCVDQVRKGNSVYINVIIFTIKNKFEYFSEIWNAVILVFNSI